MVDHRRVRPPLLSLARALVIAAVVAIAAGCDRGSASNDAKGDGNDAASDSGANGQGNGQAATIAIIRAADWIGSEWSEDAIRVGLQEQGLEEGRDFRFKVSSAQGDLATLPNLLDEAVDAKAKVIVTLQDPTLKTALQRVKTVPIVFHVLADPFAAGAGTSDSNHLPNVTGVYSPGLGDPEQEKRIELIRRILPRAQRIGVLFSPDEPYAVAMKDKMTQAGRRARLEVVAVPVTNMNEGAQAATTLVGRRVDAIEIFGNTAHAAFPSIMQVAKQSKVPVFSPSPFEMLKGATAAIYPDFAEGGIVAGQMIGRIMKGESPEKIPFFKVEKTKTSVSSENAKAANVTIPPDVAKQADTTRRR
jgi:putative tryptophan/tyrosine transport system substrate-binding protein